MGRCKKWTPHEINFLKENWAEMQIKRIAKSLNRSLNAVKIKAYKLKLTDRRYLQEEITYPAFTEMLGRTYGDSWFKKRLIEADFPFVNYKVVNDKITMVNLDLFLKWFKNNLHEIDISNTNDGDFNAIEPNWLIEKRKADKMAQCYKPRFWTKEEDERLISLLNKFKYGYREISIKLKRTEGAIKRRMLDLKLKERPIKADNHIFWTDKEIETVKDMYLKGYKSCVIAEFVPKSALAINGLLERHNYFRRINE